MTTEEYLQHFQIFVLEKSHLEEFFDSLHGAVYHHRRRLDQKAYASWFSSRVQTSQSHLLGFHCHLTHLPSLERYLDSGSFGREFRKLVFADVAIGLIPGGSDVVDGLVDADRNLSYVITNVVLKTKLGDPIDIQQ